MPKSWHTSGGNFRTKVKWKVKLNFQEYSSSHSLTPDLVECDGKPVFDLIIGCKTMMELGIALDFKNKETTIDEIILPMRDINKLQNRAWAVNNRLLHEPQSTAQETERAVKILDAKYKKADLPEVLKNNCAHLSAKDQQKLLELLLEFEELFDGTLGDWDTEHVSFQLQPGATPYKGRPFPVPKIHKETLLKEIERLCKLGVLVRQSDSEWASPSSIVPKVTKLCAS
jgi:hypothetical protein